MEGLFEYLMQIDAIWVYTLLCLSAYAENIIPPIPGDTIVVFGAYLVGTGVIDFAPAFAVTTIGSLAGFMSLYWLGRVFGKSVVETERWKLFASDDFKRVETWFERYGYAIIAANRFLSGTRSVISLFAGIAVLRLKIVLVFALVSCALWNFILMYAGYAIGDNWHLILEYIKQYNIIVFAAVGILLLVLVIRKYIWNRRVQ